MAVEGLDRVTVGSSIVSAPHFHPPCDRPIAVAPLSRWRQLGITLLVSGLALQLGTLPAAARSSQTNAQTLRSSNIWAIATTHNVASNDAVPRRGDSRPR